MITPWSFFLLLVASLSVFTGCNPIRRELEALFLLQHVTSHSGTTMLERTSDPPLRTSIQWTEKGKRFRGDLYFPAEKASGRLLLLPGAAEEGKDDPRLVIFASALARVRFVVLVPDLVGSRSLRVKSEDVQDVVAAARRLATGARETEVAGIGICAFSYAVGPAVLAALTPEIRQQIAYIVCVGGYYSLPDVLRFATTGYFIDNGEWRYLPPNDFGKWLFVLNNVDRVTARHDREVLRQIALRKAANEAADTGALARSVGTEGRSILAFVTNRDPTLVHKLMGSLPLSLRKEIGRLNLANKDLSLLQARLLLVHGRNDDIIPFTESLALAQAAPPDKAELFLAEGLFHVELRGSIVQNWALWRAAVALLRARDGNG